MTRTAASLLAVAGLLATVPLAAHNALAADLGSGPGRYPAPLAPSLAIERWTGFYLGAALGGGFGRTDIDGSFGAGAIETRGFLGSIYGGYNWQVGRMVVGLEGDIGTGSLGGGASNGVVRYIDEIATLGSLRARAGFLMTPALLLYGTAGMAWVGKDIGIDGGEVTRHTFTGYQVGLGAEWMLSSNWTMRLEYVYTGLGDKTLTHSGLTNSFDPDFHTVRAGLSFKF